MINHSSIRQGRSGKEAREVFDQPLALGRERLNVSERTCASAIWRRAWVATLTRLGRAGDTNQDDIGFFETFDMLTVVVQHRVVDLCAKSSWSARDFPLKLREQGRTATAGPRASGLRLDGRQKA